MLNLIVDTDLGVDDAAAVAWLLCQRERPVRVVGLSAVWGNAPVEQVFANVHALLDALGHSDIPVARGEGPPAGHRPSRVGSIAHGPDGLWGQGQTSREPGPPGDLVELYRKALEQHPGATLLALGPLTNLAKIQRDAPELLRRLERIVVLGGAKHHGSITPVSETNFWHDPAAARDVLAADLPITLVTREAHRGCTMSTDQLDAIRDAPTPAARFVAEPMRGYARATQRFGEPVSFPDVVAAMVAVSPATATKAQPALVRVIVAEGLTRGQSIIGLSAIERLTMIDEGEGLQRLIERVLTQPELGLDSAVARLLASEPDNARVVLEVDAARVQASFMAAITGTP